jgi:hypothetical protein
MAAEDYIDFEDWDDMNSEPVWVRIEFISVVRETPKAVLFQLEPGVLGRRQWVPKSLIGNINERENQFTVESWFAEKEEFLDD